MFLKCLGLHCSTKRKSSYQKHYPSIIHELCHEFSVAELRKSTNNFDIKRVRGHSCGYPIYKGYLQRNCASDYTVALMRFDTQGYRTVEEFENEIELMCQLHHPNCVSLIGFCNDKNEKIIVYEYMSNGSLYEHLVCGKLSWKKRLEICIGTARALHYLHAGLKRTIIHLDVKPTNILLDHNMHPKLAGFSLILKGPRFMAKPKPIQVHRIMGTYGYMAEEYCFHGIVTDKCDVFSFGMVLLEVVCGGKYIKMETNTETEFVEKPLEEKIDPKIVGKIAPECWQVFKDIMARCLEYEAEERPTMGEVKVELEHALSLQEQADITNTIPHYTLLSKTIINPQYGGQISDIEEEITKDSDLEEDIIKGSDLNDTLPSYLVPLGHKSIHWG